MSCHWLHSCTSHQVIQAGCCTLYWIYSAIIASCSSWTATSATGMLQVTNTDCSTPSCTATTSQTFSFSAFSCRHQQGFQYCCTTALFEVLLPFLSSVVLSRLNNKVALMPLVFTVLGVPTRCQFMGRNTLWLVLWIWLSWPHIYPSQYRKGCPLLKQLSYD